MFFDYFPIKYNEPLFRPPSEAESLILQVTLGCTWNKCAFCEMYGTKKFRVREEEDVFREIKSVASVQPGLRKLFLADGNPMVLSAKRLLNIINFAKQSFPKLRRVSTYALPTDLLSKTKEELIELKNAGLDLVYVGIESGDDEVLSMINKGETFRSTVDGLLKAREAGIKLSVITINGLGGTKYSEQHAVNSARILNAIQPEFASVLVLSFPFGVEKYQKKFNGDFREMSITDLLKEMELFMRNTELERTIFRSNHASNYLVLSGVLSKDKQAFLNAIDFAINNPESAGLREEWMRGY